MRFVIGSTTASLLLASAALLSAAPAFAGADEAQRDSFWTSGAGRATHADAGQNDRYTASYHRYIQMDPRDTKVDPNANKNVDADNIYFNHSMGTMSGN